MRKVHIRGKEWEWRVGKKYVLIISPEKKKYHPFIFNVLCIPEWLFNDPYRESSWSVMPSDIKNYIIKEVL